MKLLGKYRNGNYDVRIYDDGTKIRETEENEFIPAFSENCDVKLTACCSIGCKFCYENCTPAGKHAEIDFSSRLFDSLHPYTEFALNGNDMDHPQLEELLVKLREKKVIANITLHADQFLNNFMKVRRLQHDGLVFGIGISVSGVASDRQAAAVDASKKLRNCVFHTIAGVTSPEEYETLAEHKCKVLVLGYKELGRGVGYEAANQTDIQEKRKWLYDNLENLSEKCAVLSFDNLAIEQLDVKRIMSDEQWEEFYMGDDGQYTFYIDLVKKEYAMNSLSGRRFPLENKTVDEMFTSIRTKK